MADERNPQLRIGTGPTAVEITSEPYVIYTRRGYAAVLDVKVLPGGFAHMLYISARSLSDGLEELRVARGSLAGARLNLRKEDDSQFAKYIVEESLV